jgi:hypothetical protein
VTPACGELTGLHDPDDLRAPAAATLGLLPIVEDAAATLIVSYAR